MIDYLIIGSGLTGSTIARILHDCGLKVLIIDRRCHIGGNVYDHTHESGIRIHTYGPHYFRTSDEGIWEFANRFSEFTPYIPCLKSLVDGRYENWPIAASYIDREIGKDWVPSFKGDPNNFEEAALALMPEKIYHKFIRGYNIKQWGINPTSLSKDLIKRFDVRIDGDPRLMPNHKYQGIPKEGYAKWMENILTDIPVLLNVDYLKNKNLFNVKKKIIYTGPIDAYFDDCFGKLKYRGQKRTNYYIENIDFKQPCGQVNNPDLNNGLHIRSLEWKHMMDPKYASKIEGTVITHETTVTPENPNEYEYPFPDIHNKNLYKKYFELSKKESNLLICGRLGEYRYYDMDQAIGRAMKLVKNLMCQ
jgi:UDP-galactopyranose mutase